jgi:hypothetical protein
MQKLIPKVSEFGDLQGAMRRWCQENSIEKPKIMTYPLERISRIYEKISDRYVC